MNSTELLQYTEAHQRHIPPQQTIPHDSDGMASDMELPEPPPPYETVEFSSPSVQPPPSSDRTLAYLGLTGTSAPPNVPSPSHSHHSHHANLIDDMPCPILSSAESLSTPSAPPLPALMPLHLDPIQDRQQRRLSTSSSSSYTSAINATLNSSSSGGRRRAGRPAIVTPQNCDDNVTDEGAVCASSATSASSSTVRTGGGEWPIGKRRVRATRDIVPEESALRHYAISPLHTSSTLDYFDGHPSSSGQLYPSGTVMERVEAQYTGVHRQVSTPLPDRSSSPSSSCRLTQRSNTLPSATSYPHYQQHPCSLHTLPSSTSSYSATHYSPSIMDPIPLSQSVVPAPPPRLLHFQSREPSSVPACPFPLCQKPIALTKTRLERGVTVWLVCGILFLLNTYWTTHSLLSHFASPEQIQQKPPSSGSILIDLGQSLFRGSSNNHNHLRSRAKSRPYSTLAPSGNRQTITTMGMLQDEQNTLQMLIRFLFSAILAIIRWWLCLTPLLVRPLFDTVHSCPHPHPYPYLIKDEEQKPVGQIDEQQVVSGTGVGRPSPSSSNLYPLLSESSEDPLTTSEHAGSASIKQMENQVDDSAVDEKRHLERYYSNDWTPRHQASAPPVAEAEDSPGNTLATTTDELTTAESRPMPVNQATQEGRQLSVTELAPASVVSPDPRTTSKRRWIKFWKQQRQQSTGVPQTGDRRPPWRQRMHERRLEWRVRRAQLKSTKERERVVRLSQDIGRYSLLYVLGSYLQLGTMWKQSVLQPGKIVAEDD